MEISPELNRLLCAALVSQTFREKLLDNPGKAILEGYHLGAFGIEKFDLTDEETQTISTIQAKTIQDFAAQIIKNNSPPKMAPSLANGSAKNSINGHHPYSGQIPGNGKHSLQSNV